MELRADFPHDFDSVRDDGKLFFVDAPRRIKKPDFLCAQSNGQQDPVDREMKERRKKNFLPRRSGIGCGKDDAALRRLPAEGIFQSFAREGGRNQGVLRADARAGAAPGAP